MPANLITNGLLSLQLLLPVFNQFAERAGLDIALPLNDSRVTKSYVSKNKNALMVVFDGHYQFNWDSVPEDVLKGRILYYDNSNSVARLEGPRLADLTGRKSLISSNEASEIAERCLKKLGYDLGKAKADPPRVVQWMYGEEKIPLPAYSVRWFPNGSKKPHWSELLVEVEVSGLTKRVTRIESLHGATSATVVDIRKFMTNRTDKARPP
jgi:hypothetical protein